MKAMKCPVLLLALLLLTACAAPAAEEHSTTLFAMDTVMGVTVYGAGGQEAADAAAGRIRALEKLFSVTGQNSDIYAANHSGGEAVNVSEETAALLERALELCASTGGALDVTIYPIVKAWGFTTGEYQVPDGGELSSLLERVDYGRITLEGERLTVPDGMELDLGAVAKGWTGDRVAALLTEAGVTSAKLELGGNVQVVGAKPDGSPWRVAVRDPNGESYAGIVEVTDKAVVTSGGYERYFEADGITYWHIIDPADGRPARSGLASVTVVSGSGVQADALSTALFVLGAEGAADYWREHRDFDMILLGEDGTVTVSEGIAGSFSLYGDWEGRSVEIVK